MSTFACERKTWVFQPLGEPTSGSRRVWNRAEGPLPKATENAFGRHCHYSRICGADWASSCNLWRKVALVKSKVISKLEDC